MWMGSPQQHCGPRRRLWPKAQRYYVQPDNPRQVRKACGPWCITRKGRHCVPETAGGNSRRPLPEKGGYTVGFHL